MGFRGDADWSFCRVSKWHGDTLTGHFAGFLNVMENCLWQVHLLNANPNAALNGKGGRKNMWSILRGGVVLLSQCLCTVYAINN